MATENDNRQADPGRKSASLRPDYVIDLARSIIACAADKETDTGYNLHRIGQAAEAIIAFAEKGNGPDYARYENLTPEQCIARLNGYCWIAYRDNYGEPQPGSDDNGYTVEHRDLSPKGLQRFLADWEHLHGNPLDTANAEEAEGVPTETDTPPGPAGTLFLEIQAEEEALHNSLDEFPLGLTEDPRATPEDETLHELAQVRDLMRVANDLMERVCAREQRYSADSGYQLPEVA